MAVPVKDDVPETAAPESVSAEMDNTIAELSEFLTAPNPRLRAVAVQNMVRKQSVHAHRNGDI